jgi:hypothetical protein
MMRVGAMADFEIRRELETATGERRAELAGELASRKRYRSSWKPARHGLLPVGSPGAARGLG